MVLKIVEMILNVCLEKQQGYLDEKEILLGVCGVELNGICFYSVCFLGFIVYQEVMFGMDGQMLKLCYDFYNWVFFMLGVKLLVE